MNKQDLSKILYQMVSNAPKGKLSVQYHLFGIKHCVDIKNADFSVEDIIVDAGLSKSLSIEVRKGMKLSEFVELKNNNTYGRLQDCYEEKNRLEDLVKKQSEKIKQMQGRL